MIAQFSGREFVGGEFGGGSTGRPAAVCRSKAGTSTPWLSRVDVSLLSSMGKQARRSVLHQALAASALARSRVSAQVRTRRV